MAKPVQLELDSQTNTCTVNGKTAGLDHKEFHLLSLLVAEKGRIVSASELRKALWLDREMSYSALTSLVGSLRLKLVEEVVYSARGLGYGVRGDNGGLIAVIVPGGEDEALSQPMSPRPPRQTPPSLPSQPSPRAQRRSLPNLQLDFTELDCKVSDAFAGLSPKQFRLLAVLHANAGRYVDQGYLEKALMGDKKPESDYIAMVIGSVVKKMPDLVIHSQEMVVRKQGRGRNSNVAFGIANAAGNIQGVARKPVSPFEGA